MWCPSLIIGSKIPTIPDDGQLRLYSMRFCPFAQRAHLVLDAKNIPYHTININLLEKPEWLNLKSPLGKVPALEIPTEKGHPTIVESLIICEYLDEKYPQTPLLPKDPLKKANDKILVERFTAVSGPILKIILNGVENSPGALTDITQGLDNFEKELGERKTKFFSGNKPGWVDYMIWPWCERVEMLKYLIGDKFEMDQQRFKHLIKWRELMIDDAGVKVSYLDGETHAKYIKSRHAGHPDYDMLVSNVKRQRTA